MSRRLRNHLSVAELFVVTLCGEPVTRCSGTSETFTMDKNRKDELLARGICPLAYGVDIETSAFQSVKSHHIRNELRTIDNVAFAECDTASPAYGHDD